MGAFEWFKRRIRGAELEKETQLSYITLIGVLGEIIAGLPKDWSNLEGTPEELDRSLMFLGTRYDGLMHDNMVALLENLEIFKTNLELRIEIQKRVDLLRERLEKATGAERESLRFQIYQEERKLRDLDQSLTFLRNRFEEDAKIVVSKAIPKVDPKTIVLDKPMPLIMGGGGYGLIPGSTVAPLQGQEPPSQEPLPRRLEE